MSAMIERLSIRMQVTLFIIYSAISLLVIGFIDLNLSEVGWQYMGWLTTILGILCVYLVAKKDIRNYIVGVLSVITYGFFAFHSGYLYDYLTNIYILVPVQIIGFYAWVNHEDKDEDYLVEVAPIKYVKTLTTICIIAILLLSTVFYNFVSVGLKGVPSELPYILKLFDATTTVTALMAQYLMIKRYREQWILWIIYNFISILMWGYFFMQGQNTLSMIVMFVVYLIVAIYGYYNWGEK